jgi:transcriptional regulator with XRE-family HTH domain
MTSRERARANARALRANGLSISQVAERLGVSQSTVSGWLRGRGEWYEVRECLLRGERFIAGHGAQRFCSKAHGAKYARVFGAPSTVERYQRRANELEAELERLHARLAERGRP